MTNHPNRSKKSPSPARNPSNVEVKALRESAGLTQAALAALLHCTTRNVQQWECGIDAVNHRRIPPAVFELMRLKLGCHEKFELVERKRLTSRT